jgi:linoleoyl-CoA desaturase
LPLETNKLLMDGIKFKGKDSADKLFWKTLKANVHHYFDERMISPKGNAMMWLKTMLMYLFYLAPFVLLLLTPLNGWVACVFVVVMGIGKAGIGMSVMHDGLHGSYSTRKWVNRLAGASMYLIGSNVFNWKIQHNIYHHAYTNITGLDEDIQTRWIIRLSEHTPLKPIHRYQHIYALFLYSLMTFSMLIGDITQLIGYNKTGITARHQSNPAKEMTVALGVKLVYLFVMIGLPILFTSFFWWQVLLGFAIMHLVAGFIFSMVFQMAHIVEGALQPPAPIDGIQPTEWAVHQLQTTVNFAPNNRLLNWYVGGLNFQVEHHLFPNICHIHYKNISTIVRQTAMEFGIPYHSIPTLQASLASHTKRLKALGGHING